MAADSTRPSPVLWRQIARRRLAAAPAASSYWRLNRRRASPRERGTPPPPVQAGRWSRGADEPLRLGGPRARASGRIDDVSGIPTAAPRTARGSATCSYDASRWSAPAAAPTVVRECTRSIACETLPRREATAVPLTRSRPLGGRVRRAQNQIEHGSAGRGLWAKSMAAGPRIGESTIYRVEAGPRCSVIHRGARWSVGYISPRGAHEPGPQRRRWSAVRPSGWDVPTVCLIVDVPAQLTMLRCGARLRVKAGSEGDSTAAQKSW